MDQHKIEKLYQYLLLLCQWNEKMNLVSLQDLDDLIIGHVLDSLGILEIGSLQGKIIDIGPGAGFPGIILAVFQPDNQYVFFEPNKKYYIFLKKVISELSLKNVQLINSRVENHIKSDEISFDHIFSRAVGDMNFIFNICRHLVNKHTVLYFLKGEQYLQEIQQLEHKELKIFFIKKVKILEMYNKNHYIIALIRV